MTSLQDQDQRAQWSARVRQLNATPRAELAAIVCDRMRAEGRPIVLGPQPGQWSKDDLVNDIAKAEFPAIYRAGHAEPHFMHHELAGNDWCICPCSECHGHVEGLEGMDCECVACGCHAEVAAR
jgi:hypothetical protein